MNLPYEIIHKIISYLSEKPFKLEIINQTNHNQNPNHEYIRFIDQILKSDTRYPLIQSIQSIINTPEKSYVILPINAHKHYEYSVYIQNLDVEPMYMANIQRYKDKGYVNENDELSKILYICDSQKENQKYQVDWIS